MKIKIATNKGHCSAECDLFSGCRFKSDIGLPGKDCLGDGEYELSEEIVCGKLILKMLKYLHDNGDDYERKARDLFRVGAKSGSQSDIERSARFEEISLAYYRIADEIKLLWRPKNG